MAKDRAAPFSKKHRRTWIPVTGGMVLIGLINLGIGMYLYSQWEGDAPRARPKTQTTPADAGVDAGVDAAPPTPR